MIKTILSVLLAGSLVLVGTTQAQAADVEVGSTISNAYIFRGVTLNDEGVFQPEVNVDLKNGVNLNVWGNLDLGDYDGAVTDGEFSKIDLTASYDVPLEFPVDTQVGVIHYTYPGVVTAGTTELFAKFSYEVYQGVLLGTDVYFDIDEFTDVYVNFNGSVDVSKFVNLPEGFSSSVGLGIGVIGDDFALANGGTEGGFNEFDLNATVEYAVNEQLTVAGFVGFVDNLDKDVLPEQDADFYGGVSATYNF